MLRNYVTAFFLSEIDKYTYILYDSSKTQIHFPDRSFDLMFDFITLSYKCPFLFFLGIPCPGCGMTRALLSLLRLDFAAAFHYHPLFPLVIFWFLYGIRLYFYRKIPLTDIQKKRNLILLSLTCVLFFVVYFIRLFSGSDVVYTDFEHAVLWKVFFPDSGFYSFYRLFLLRL